MFRSCNTVLLYIALPVVVYCLACCILQRSKLRNDLGIELGGQWSLIGWLNYNCLVIAAIFVPSDLKNHYLSILPVSNFIVPYLIAFCTINPTNK